MKIEKIKIEKIKTWNKHFFLKKILKTHQNYKKGMETNETRKGKYNKKNFKKKKITKTKEPNKE